MNVRFVLVVCTVRQKEALNLLVIVTLDTTVLLGQNILMNILVLCLLFLQTLLLLRFLTVQCAYQDTSAVILVSEFQLHAQWDFIVSREASTLNPAHVVLMEILPDYDVAKNVYLVLVVTIVMAMDVLVQQGHVMQDSFADLGHQFQLPLME